MKKRSIFVRVTSLIIATLMLSAVFIGCKKGGGNTEAQTSAEGENTAPTFVTTGGEDAPKTKVPADLYYGNEEPVYILLPKLCEPEFSITEPTSIIEEAVIERNIRVEERLGIKFNYTVRDEALSGAYQTIIRNTILGGEEILDIIAGNAYYTSTLASEGMFFDLNTVDDENYISSDLAWYNESFVKNTAYKNKLYFLVGDVTLGATDRTPVMFFNEDKLKEWQIEDDVYQVAIDGKWTIDYMKTLIKDVYREEDGIEGKTKGDIYGLFFNSGSMCIDAMLTAVGIRITETDTEGNIRVSWADGTAADAYAAIYELMYNTSGVFLGTVDGGAYYGEKEITNYYSEQAFLESRALFSYGMLSAAKKFATDPDLHYGILPLPKYTEDQEYGTTPQDGFTVVALSSNIGDRLGIATAALETLSEYSYNIIRPVYYDTAYKVRFASSADTAKLFDSIIESITYDFGMFYSNSIGNPLHRLRNRLSGTGTAANSSITGVTASYTGATTKMIEQLLAKFDENN